VKTARAGKFFGRELPAGADVTDDFNPDDMASMQMLLTKAVKLVPEKVEEKPEPEEKVEEKPAPKAAKRGSK
jgi:hypothetical protein